MKYRKLRIAWSGTSCVLCLILLVLWVRSYSAADLIGCGNVQNDSATLTALISSRGVLVLQRHTSANSPSLSKWTSGSWEHHVTPPRSPASRFTLSNSDALFAIGCPMWFLGLLLILSAWLPWSGLIEGYSLRTLLIATTLVAVVLGAVVYVVG